MSDDYTLDDALSDLWSAGKEMDGSGGRAETWIRLRIADLEAKAEVAASMQCQNGTGAWQCVRVRGHNGLHVREPHPASALEQRIDVLREATLTNVEQLSERIERLEKDLRDTHDLAERAATAHLERKPEPTQIKEDEPGSLFSTGGTGQPAPEHLSEGRLPKRDLATGELLEQECQASTLVPDGPDIPCARERWHTGPHMDITAIAHAGKAGEVWE